MALVISNSTGSRPHEENSYIYESSYVDWCLISDACAAFKLPEFADGPARDGRHRMAKQVRGIMIHTLYLYFYIIRKGKSELVMVIGAGCLVISIVTCYFSSFFPS